MSRWKARGYVWISEWQKILEGRDCNLQSRREREACTDCPRLEKVKPAWATWNRAVGQATSRLRPGTPWERDDGNPLGSDGVLSDSKELPGHGHRPRAQEK